MPPSYVVERWPLGWLIRSAPGVHGVPVSAFTETRGLFPGNSIMDGGIAHHLRTTGQAGNAVMCIATPEDSRRWRREITEWLAVNESSAERRWWCGVDVGTSSAAMFAVLVDGPLLAAAACEFGKASTPRDADDFGRCKRLIADFPDWRPRLHEVASAYPNTAWPAIIDRWDELVRTTPERQTEILREIEEASHATL